MNRAILLSIKPKYCELIANGKKTLEIRKTKPKLKPPFKCLIYCTKPKHPHEDYITIEPQCSYEDFISLDSEAKKAQACQAFYGGSKVIGEFICDGIIDLHDNGNEFVTPFNSEITELLIPFSCLSYKELHDYANGKKLYAWHISDLRIYDKPKELWEFCYPSEKYCEKGLCEGCPYDEVPNEYLLKSYGTEYDYDCGGERPLTRSPRSWCYVEELRNV